MSPYTPSHLSYIASDVLIDCLGVFWSFLDQEEAEAAVFSSLAPPNNQNLDLGVRVNLHDPLKVPDGLRTLPSTG